jgi:hypothetical protein
MKLLAVISAAVSLYSMIVGRNEPRITLNPLERTALVGFDGKTVQVTNAVDEDPRFSVKYLPRQSVLPECNEIKPNLPYLKVSCRAGTSKWAVQYWDRLKSNYGGRIATFEIHISHWTGSPAKIFASLDCTRPIRLVGHFEFHGKPVFGYKVTRTGVPLDPYGRNIYLDVLDSKAYGKGWARENSFLANAPDGSFRYAFWDESKLGTKLRLSAIGPGVSPIVQTIISNQCNP